MKPGYYSTYWRFKCLLCLVGQVSCLHNAADLQSYIPVWPRKYHQFAGGKLSCKSHCSNINNRSCFWITSKVQICSESLAAEVWWLFLCEEATVQVLLVRQAHSFSWQLLLCLILLFLVEVPNRTINYDKPTASPISYVRNPPTQSAAVVTYVLQNNLCLLCKAGTWTPVVNPAEKRRKKKRERN